MKKLLSTLTLVVFMAAAFAGNPNPKPIIKVADKSNIESVMKNYNDSWTLLGSVNEISIVEEVLADRDVDATIKEQYVYQKGDETNLVIVTTNSEVYALSVSSCPQTRKCNCAKLERMPFDFNGDGDCDDLGECWICEFNPN